MTRHMRILPALEGVDIADVLRRLAGYRFTPAKADRRDRVPTERWLGQEALHVALVALTAERQPVYREDLTVLTGLPSAAVTRALGILCEQGWLIREDTTPGGRWPVFHPGPRVTGADG